MKRIAILTQPLKTNYGGILQNYALQKVVKSMGYNVTTIDRKYNVFPAYRVVISKVKKYLFGKTRNSNSNKFSKSELEIIARNTSEFIQANINLSEQIDTDEKIIKHFKKEFYDAVIVGSDQTWRPRYSPNIYNFFLDFVNGSNVKKIAYACSFGSDEWEFNKEQTQRCRELIKRFSAISVREDSGVFLTEKHLNANASLVLDPTLLITKDEYIKLINEKDLPKTSGLFTYVLDRSIEKSAVISHVSNSLHLEEFKNQPVKGLKEMKSGSIEDFVYPSVEGWINGFQQAEFVVTDSFHGTVFSIIFNKPFIAIANKERGVARFESLLSLFDLKHRLIFNESELSDELLREVIEYEDINSKLATLKEQSFNFLKKEI